MLVLQCVPTIVWLQVHLVAAAVLPVDADPQYDGFDQPGDEDGEEWHDAQEPEDEEEEPVKAPRRDTAAYLNFFLASTLFAGHAVKVREVAVWLARLASEHRITNSAMDSFCQMVHFLLLPEGNLFPKSYHMLRGALAVEDSHDCERHICDACWELFPDIPGDSHAVHADEVCQRPGCNNPRFKRGPGGHVTPKRSAFYFGDKETFVDLVCKPDMLPAMLSHRKEAFKDPESFWNSPAGRELNARCGNKFDETSIEADEFAVLVSLGAALACVSLSWSSGECLLCHCPAAEFSGGAFRCRGRRWTALCQQAAWRSHLGHPAPGPARRDGREE